MARKAFLYTGVTFLVMMTVLIAANYFLLSERTGYESKSASLEIDTLNNLVSDVRHVTALDPNNTIADALADATFRALNCTSAGGALPSICNALLPTNILSEQCGTNLSKWVLNYTNVTLSQVQKIITFAEFNSSINKISYIAPDSCGGSSDYRSFTYFGNISYNLTTYGSFHMQLNQTILFNKTMGLAQIYSSGSIKTYEINVTDWTKRLDFSKRVKCISNLCYPCTAGDCFA